MRELEIFYSMNLNSLPESIKHDLIMQPNVAMKRSFILLRGSEIIYDIICVAGTVWTILSVCFLFLLVSWTCPDM